MGVNRFLEDPCPIVRPDGYKTFTKLMNMRSTERFEQRLSHPAS